MIYKITENNSKWTRDYLDVKYIQTPSELRIEQGNVLGKTLNDEYTLIDYMKENGTKTYGGSFNGIEGNIEIEWKGTYDELSLKDTICIQQDVNATPKFYFITGMTNLENNNMYDLTIEENIFLNNKDILKTGAGDYPKQIGMTRGHLPIESYKNKTFDVGDYKVLDKVPVKRIKDNTDSNTPWLYVFERTKSIGENGTTTDTKTKLQYQFDTDANKLILPYSVKIAPVLPIDLNKISNEVTLVDNGSGNKGDSTGNRYLREGNTLIYNVGLLTSDENIQITSEHLFYERLTVAPFWGFSESNPLNIPVSEIYDKDEYYILTNEKNAESKKWSLYNDTITFGIANQVGLAASAGRFAQLVKIRYNSITSEITIVDVNFDEYDTVRKTYGYSSLRYLSIYINGGNGKWEDWGNDRPTQWDWFQQNVEGTKYQHVLIKKIKKLGGTPSLWTSNDLVDYIEDTSKNADIINIKISNFNPIKTSEEVINGFESIENCTFEDYGTGQLATLNLIDEFYSSQQNQYIFNLDLREDWMNNLDLLQGLNTKKLMIENQKIFDIPIDNIDLVTGNVGFIHRTIPSPNEWEERIQWVTGETIYNESVIWNNEKEGFTPTNEFAQYKANNPVQSKLDLFGAFANPLTYIGNPIEGAISALGQTTGTIVQRQNMKKAPEEIRGSGNIYPDLLFNEYNSQFIIIKTLPKGTDWIEQVNGLYRNGITLDNTLYISPSNWNATNRPRFNYIAMNNFKEFMDKDDYSPAVADKFDEVLSRGLRFWNVSNIGEYAEFIDDNNDVFESFK